MEHARLLYNNINRLREARGLTLSGLAQRCGIAKVTLAGLETGSIAPAIETLWAIARALDAPFGSLLEGCLPDQPELGDANANVRLIDRSQQEQGDSIEIYSISIKNGIAKESAGHTTGVREKVIVTSGSMLVGPAQCPRLVSAGEVHSFDADVPHIYAAPHGSAQGMVFVEYPPVHSLDPCGTHTLSWPMDALGWEGVQALVERMRVEVANGIGCRVLRLRNVPVQAAAASLHTLRRKLNLVGGHEFRWPTLVLSDVDRTGPFLAVFPRSSSRAFQVRGQTYESVPTLVAAVDSCRRIESPLRSRRSLGCEHPFKQGGWTLEALRCEEALHRGQLELPIQLEGMTGRHAHDVSRSADAEAFSSRIQVDHYDAYELLHPAYSRQVVALAQDLHDFCEADLLRPLPTIDVGTGPGIPLLMRQELVPVLQPLAVEPDPVAYACLEINLGGSKSIKPLKQDFLELDVPDGGTSVVTSVGSSHHFNTAFMLQKAFGLLKPGGLLLVADEFLPVFDDSESRALALVLHHSSYILEVASLLEEGGHDAPDDEDGRIFRAFRVHLAWAVMHARTGKLIDAERVCRQLFSIADNAMMGKRFTHVFGAYARFFWLELQAMVAGFDYEVERKTHVKRFLEIASACGFELLRHRRVFATEGVDDCGGGTHVIALRRPA